jgi:hypothetical protein
MGEFCGKASGAHGNPERTRPWEVISEVKLRFSAGRPRPHRSRRARRSPANRSAAAIPYGVGLRVATTPSMTEESNSSQPRPTEEPADQRFAEQRLVTGSPTGRLRCFQHFPLLDDGILERATARNTLGYRAAEAGALEFGARRAKDRLRRAELRNQFPGVACAECSFSSRLRVATDITRRHSSAWAANLLR